MAVWQRFIDGHPQYLARHYWWAYLWPAAVWFFDHPRVINAILFGQYARLVDGTLAQIPERVDGEILQLTCVYGGLTPRLAHRLDRPLYIADVAAIQLQLAKTKTPRQPNGGLLAARMNVERCAYAPNAFGVILIFFLLHELPRGARIHVLREAVRVARPGGTLIITEYAPQPVHHLLWRCVPCRWLLTTLEPFLADFWNFDLTATLCQLGEPLEKSITLLRTQDAFNGFYRTSTYQVTVAKPR